MSRPSPRPILLVEDNETHAEAMTRALRRATCDLPIVRCPDGDEALDYLYRRGRFLQSAATARPCLILLDLHLPGRGGQELLTLIKSDAQLKAIPIVIVTTVGDPREIRRCYEGGASGFIRKRANFDETIDIARRLYEYWFWANEIPEVTSDKSSESS